MQQHYIWKVLFKDITKHCINVLYPNAGEFMKGFCQKLCFDIKCFVYFVFTWNRREQPLITNISIVI